MAGLTVIVTAPEAVFLPLFLPLFFDFPFLGAIVVFSMPPENFSLRFFQRPMVRSGGARKLAFAVATGAEPRPLKAEPTTIPTTKTPAVLMRLFKLYHGALGGGTSGCIGGGKIASGIWVTGSGFGAWDVGGEGSSTFGNGVGIA